MKENRMTLVLYPNITCNLNCTYCYIDKSPALLHIDKIFEESFKNDYYFEFSKEIFLKNVLKEIQFWGGEPSMGLHRVYHLIPKFIEYYPNLNTFMTSTNFTIPNWFDEFYGLTNILKNYPERRFIIDLQLSLDGPKYINDKNRGEGVTDLFLNNYQKLMNNIDENLPDNVELHIHFKPTHTSETISMLQNKEKIIEYFQFYDNLIYQANCHKIADISANPTVPNTAVPAPHTKQDGILFANYCKLCREIEEENKVKKYFKCYKHITSFVPRYYWEDQPLDTDVAKIKNNNMIGNCGNCGSGRSVVGLLPENKISVCHSGFTDLLEEYKQYAEKNRDWKERSILNSGFTGESQVRSNAMSLEEYAQYERMIDCFYNPDLTCKKSNLVYQIRLYAKMGQIDKKYLDEQEAIDAACYLLDSTSYCMRDNMNVTTSLCLNPPGLIKLLLNGAKEYCDGTYQRQ